MALQYERNINLEEVDSDALFGIPYLLHQTFLQKIIFWGFMILSSVTFIGTQWFLHLPIIISFFVSIVLGGIGFIFGANQNEHLSIAQYLVLLFFKPIKYVPYKSTEDVYSIKNEAKIIKEEELVKERMIASASPESQKRLLIIVVALVVGSLVFTMSFMGISSYKNNHIEHHTVGSVNQSVQIS